MRACRPLLTLLLALPLCCQPAGARADGLMVIANESVPVASLPTEELGNIYLVRKTHWSAALPVVPVNREASSASRATFSEEVLGQSPSDLAEYWNRLRFEGKRPPLVQTSDQAVVGFVRTVPGAIGYVGGHVPPSGVKVLLRLP